MEQTSKKVAAVLLMLKLIVTILLSVFPECVEIGYPFGLFTSVFLMAVAYICTSKVMSVILLTATVVMILMLIICPILLLLKTRKINTVATILQILSVIEVFSLLISLFSVGFFMKIIGLVFNITIISLLSEIKQSEKIRRMAEGELPPAQRTQKRRKDVNHSYMR